MCGLKGKSGIYIRTKEVRKILSKAHLGKYLSKKTKKKISEANMGKHRYWLGKNFSKEHRIKLSKSFKGHIVSEDTKKKISLAKKGRKFTEHHKRKLREAKLGEKNPNFGKRGEGITNWKNGNTSENKKIRRGRKFREWRELVFKKDNYTCQKYGFKNGKGKTIIFHPHHIQNFAEYPELRFAIDNGITLSKKAHDEFHKIYGKRNNTREQLIEFLKKDETDL